MEGTATGTGANLTTGTIDLRGNVLANVLTPVVGGEAITNEQAPGYYLTPARTNQVTTSANLPGLLNVTAVPGAVPNPAMAVPAAGSPLLTGAVTGGKQADSFFTPVPFRGAVGTENWLSG